MTKRRIPKDMMLTESATPDVRVASTRVEARFENVNMDVCPVCQTALRCSTANGIDVMVCDSHNIVMPRKD